MTHSFARRSSSAKQGPRVGVIWQSHRPIPGGWANSVIQLLIKILALGSSCLPTLAADRPWSVSPSLQRLQVGDDILAILGIGNADDHLGPRYIRSGIGEKFVELLLVPCDARGFEGG